MSMSFADMRFERLGVVLRPNELEEERLGVINPASARLPDGSLHLYPRIVAPGNISRIGRFSIREDADGSITPEHRGYALEPSARYEHRTRPGGYGCEDPRVTFVDALKCYLMAYVAFGPRGPEIAVAASRDGVEWNRIGLLHFKESDAPFADKDAAFFPEPVLSPSGVVSLAIYHRPTLAISVRRGEEAVLALESLPAEQREGISIGYIPLQPVLSNFSNICSVEETHRLSLPDANWGSIKVGGGTPPVRIPEGWLAVIHGVDEWREPGSTVRMRYCAGVIVHDVNRLDRILYRSYDALFVPETPEEKSGTVAHVVFPTAIDRISDREFDIYYGMADYEIGRGRLTLQRSSITLIAQDPK